MTAVNLGTHRGDRRRPRLAGTPAIVGSNGDDDDEWTFQRRERPRVTSSDSALVEIIGRHRLIQELLTAGLEVAVPQRDRGIDLIAYVDRDSRFSTFVAVPI